MTDPAKEELDPTDDFNFLLDRIDMYTCFIVGKISRMGNDNFPMSVHYVLSEILTRVKSLRNTLLE